MVKVVVGNQIFQSKKELTKKCEEVLRRHKEGTFLEGEEYEVLLGVINLSREGKSHLPKDQTKIWVESDNGVKYIMYRKGKGSKHKLKYRKVINSRSHKQQVLDELRKVIQPQVDLYKMAIVATSHGQIYCDVSGEQLFVTELEVDHYPLTFMEIVDIYLGKIGKDYHDIILKESAGQYGHKFKDNFHPQMFSKFHKDNASYRILSKKEHHKRGGKRAIIKRDLDIITGKY